MVTKTMEKTVVLAKDGTPLSVMERPTGLGTFEDYHRKVQKFRKQYGNLLDKQSFDEYLGERKKEAAREMET